MNNYNFISLNVKCPVCSKSLMDHENKVDNEANEAFIGSFKMKS